MIPTLVVIVAVIAASVAAWRALAVRRWERAVGGRLAPGADGIIGGAGAIERVPDRVRGAVLLLHGFGDTPQTMTHVAAALYARGFAVRAPLLPGHGRTLRDFASSGANAWIASAQSEYEAIRARFGPTAVVGLSMGGALATIVAAAYGDVPALVLLAPYLDAPPVVRRAGSYRHALSVVMPYISGHSERSIHDPTATAASLAYRASTPRLLHELVRVADRARAALPGITAPTLIIQSKEDNRIAPGVATAARDALGSDEKELVWVDGCGHVLTVDYKWEAIAGAVGDWIERHRGGEKK